MGGCVRDLLLGRAPKDYDIATEARPQQVKRVFPRNCRIIGRRFKLAHLHFHGNTKILECSTFRRPPQQSDEGEDVLITRDNEFGTSEEDALRRDFTVNALFLDPTRDTILDFCDGLRDLKAQLIRTIGEPRVRFREDPVRILRAAKFAGRLGFAIEAETFQAMCDTSEDLVRSAPPRVLEEILRLLRGGHAFDSFKLLREVGALRVLLPVVADFLDRADADERTDFWRTIDALDRAVQDGHTPQNGVLLGALMVGPVLAKAARNPDRSPSLVAEDLLGPFCAALRLPRKDTGCLKRICGVQHRFVQADDEKRYRIEGFVHGPYFLEALDLFALRADALELAPEVVGRWRETANELLGGIDRHRDDFGGGDVSGHDDDASAPPTETVGDESDAPPTEAVGDDAPTYDEDRANTEAALAADPVADDAAPSNPWEQPGEGGRRRRRRRRGRGRGRDDANATAAGPAPSGSDADDLREVDDAPPSLRAAAPRAVDGGVPADDAPADDADVIVPIDAEDESDVDVAVDAAPTDARATDDAAQGDGRRRRRRRRRGGRGRNRDERFPPSDAPAPHGEAVDAEAGAHDAPQADDRFPRDPDAPDSARREPAIARREPGIARREPGTVDHDDAEADAFAPAADAHAHGEGESGDDAPAEQAGEAQGEDGGRRRRRRRRRGRGRGRDGEPTPQGDESPAGERQLHAAPEQPQRHEQRQQHHQGRHQHGQPQRGQQQGRQQQGRQQQGRHQQGGQQQGGQQQRGQQQGRPQQGGQPQGDRNDRGGRRGRGRDRDRGHGRPRDVDVVPRYRDRRGEVDVIEPAALDLSAFDVELDPKRVPTFGSIVEGKGRQKKRAPRVPEDGVDDYRPPPPPGDSGGPAAPPPPPPADTPDTFGDW